MAGKLMFLLDTNIFLEYILKRSRVQEVKDFFGACGSFHAAHE
jgi:hypothetical protein